MKEKLNLEFRHLRYVSHSCQKVFVLYILKFTNHVLRALKYNSHFKLKCTLGMNGVRPFLSSSVLFVLLN